LKSSTANTSPYRFEIFFKERKDITPSQKQN
jgi:hypothetical protein